ncbi:MAG: type II secretion system protein [Candidatus Peribacteria bacterium]|nr:MAG: type II secretion system protein [Candidatus Peribacteria bacterium]
MNQRKKAFTITELLVSVTILIILTTLGFYTYTENLVDARDSERTSDLAKISAALDLYKQKK